MTDKKLLFIHKDATSASLSHSSDDERRRVLQHVQINRLSKLRMQPGYTTGLSKGKMRAGGRKLIPRTERQAKQLTTKASPDDIGIHDQVIESKRTIEGSIRNDRRQASFIGGFIAFPTSSSSEDSEQDVSSPESIPSCGDAADPFGTACIPIKAGMHRHIQYYLTVSHPRIWDKEKDAFHGQYQFKQSAFDRITDCLKNEMSMYAMLASSASQMQYIDGLEPIENVRVLIHKAIVAAGKRLRQNELVNDNLIYDINALANAEFFSFDTKAARIHLKFVKQLIVQTGGLIRLSQFMKEWFLAGDESVAAELFEKPFFHFSEYDPGPSPNASRSYDDADWARMDDFLKDCDVFVSSPSLEQIVLDLVEWSQEMKNQLRSGTERSLMASFSYQQARWLHLRAAAMRSRLLHLKTDTWKEELTRLALLAWAYMIMTVSGRRRTMKVMASRLKAMMCASPVLRWKNHALLLWILIVAACASEGHADQQAWFFEKILVVCWRSRAESRILTEEAAVEALGVFLYVDELQRSMIHELFKTLKIGID